ncbi:MAG: exonuclease domain-containing protein [Pseudomonadota bacterium]
MEFVALDVELANPDMSSICQIGVARFSESKVTDEWATLVDPETHFDAMNVYIHGIDEERVLGAPTFEVVFNEIQRRLSDQIVVTHTHCDRVALQRACSLSELPQVQCTWLDSARVVRRTWPELARSGYGLANVCDKIGYQFKHHDALEDAKAAGQILLAASAEAELDLDGWFKRIALPIDPNKRYEKASVTREGDADGPLFGETIVFTGALKITRQAAADLSARVGCNVGSSVTKKTTMLCVGDQDTSRLAGESKSSKHRKAEALIEAGQPIRIIRETDFVEMVSILES